MNSMKRSEDLPVTQKMLNETRQALEHKITSVSLDVKSLNANLMGRIDSAEAALGGRIGFLDGRMNSFEGRMDSLDGRMNSFEGRMDSLDGRMNSLEGRIDSVETTLNGRIDSLDARLTGRIDSLDAKLTGRIDSLEAKMDSKFEVVLSEIRKVSASVEEQNTRNKYVMDQYAGVISRMDRHESEVDERLTNIEDAVFGRKDQ